MHLPENIPALLTQEQVTQQSVQYIKDRASGKIKPLETCYSNLNNLVGGGFEPNTIAVLSGLSGSGKSTFSKRIIYSITNNCLRNNKKVVSLCFNFEMLAHKTVGREFANRKNITLTELYSNYEPVSQEVINEIEKEGEKLSKYHIYYVEEPKTPKVIAETILFYWDKWCSKELDKTMIVEIDHTMLTRGGEGDSDKQKIDSLMEYLIQIKKKIASIGGNILILVLSQMNRDIRSNERMKPAMQRPTTSDLFQSSTMEFAADYIIIAHNPSKLNLDSYTEDNKPTKVMVDVVNESTGEIYKEERPFIYFHLLKNRDNESDLTATMIGELKYFNYIPITAAEFRALKEERDRTSTCNYKLKTK